MNSGVSEHWAESRILGVKGFSEDDLPVGVLDSKAHLRCSGREPSREIDALDPRTRGQRNHDIHSGALRL